MNNDLNNCDEIRSQLLELNPTDSLTDEVKKHLDLCTACTSFHQDISAVNHGIESMPEHDVSDEVFKQTLQTIQASTTASKHKGINPQWATGLAASFVLVAVTGLIYNGSMSEFQVDFNQIPAASAPELEPEPKSNAELEKRENRQQPAEKAEANKAGSGTSVDLVYLQDSEEDTQMRSRRMPAKPAPAVKNTLDEIIAQEPAPINAPLIENDNSANEAFDGAKAVADRMMQADENNDMAVQDQYSAKKGSISVSGSRIIRSEVEPNVSMKEEGAELSTDGLMVSGEAEDERQNKNEMSLDQLLQVVQTSSSEENRQRESQFKSQENKLAKDKAKHSEPLAKVNSKGDLVEAKQRYSEARPDTQPRRDAKNDEFVASVEESEAVDFDDNLGGLFGRSLAGAGTALGADDAAIKYLAELQVTENLSFKSATGYWANSYLPGDPNMRWIQAKVQQANQLDLPGVHQNVQPFDYPSNAALGLFLNSDHKTLNETGPTRMRLQVGIQAGQQKGGHRSALNLAIVLDLGQQQRADLKAESKALLSALLKAKQPSDQISVYLVGPGGGQLVSAENFRHGSIQVALDKVFNHESATTATDFDLYQTLIVANDWLKTQDDPNAVLGSSAVLLVSANNDFTASTPIESLVQQNAIDGITLSTVSLAGIEHRTHLQRLALMGQGHSRVLAGVQDAERLINEELLVSSRAVARALRLQIKLAEGVQLIDVLDSYSLDEAQAQKVRDAEQSLDQRMSKNLGITADRGKDDDGIQMVIPSYFAGDTHVIILDVLVEKSGPVAEVSAKYKDLIYLRNATSQKNLHLSSGQNTLGPLELNVMKNVLAQRLSQTVNQASLAIRAGDHQTAVVKLKTILELYQAMRQHIPAWKSDAEMTQDESIIKQYLQLLNSQTSINPQQYQLIADSLSFMSWRKLISHSP